MKNMLEIKMVNVTNENDVLKSTVHDLNSTISRLELELRGLDDEVVVIKKELEESNKMRKSGN